MYPTANKSVQREPMSISSITTNQDSKLPKFLSEPSSSHRIIKEAQTLPHYNFYQDISRHITHSRQQHHLIRSPPTTPERNQQYIHSPPSSPHSFDFSPSSSPHGYGEEEEEEDGSGGGTRTVTLQERRQRNKAASAKYRQKKNMQQHEMRSMILQISERNGLLERQLREMREENQKLRLDADKLRGKSVAKKLLRQWMDRQKKHAAAPQFNNQVGGDALKSSYNMEIDLLDVDDDDDDSSSSEI
ncbi:hypothetical protein EDC94DRAFT_613302 [Helicostylum pulchrum]|nr:hypothetical protein EDC94DRAFT_613302 [Helicostylum pulchrum]